MVIYIRKMEMVDEYDNIVFKVSRCPAEPALKNALKSLRYMDGDGVIRRILRYFDEDAKKLLNIGDKDGK